METNEKDVVTEQTAAVTQKSPLSDVAKTDRELRAMTDHKTGRNLGLNLGYRPITPAAEAWLKELGLESFQVLWELFRSVAFRNRPNGEAEARQLDLSLTKFWVETVNPQVEKTAEDECHCSVPECSSKPEPARTCLIGLPDKGEVMTHQAGPVKGKPLVKGQFVSRDTGGDKDPFEVAFVCSYHIVGLERDAYKAREAEVKRIMEAKSLPYGEAMKLVDREKFPGHFRSFPYEVAAKMAKEANEAIARSQREEKSKKDFLASVSGPRGMRDLNRRR